jgi:hypothetical protein
MFGRLLTTTTLALLLGHPVWADDLTGYLIHPPVTIRLLDAGREQKEAEVRGFLWDNWSHHRLAHIAQTAYSIEGERSVFRFFVEPDSTGAWRIRVKIERELRRNPTTHIEPTSEIVEISCAMLERVEIPTDLLRPLTPIPTNANRVPTLHRLHPHCGPERGIPTLW